jgi:hypothetical protein
LSELEIRLGAAAQEVLFADARFKVLNAGRGFGKTSLILADSFQHMAEPYTDAHGQRMPHNMVYVTKYRDQAKDIFWSRLKEFYAPMGPKFNNSDLIASFPNGATFQLKGSTDPGKLRGRYLTRAYLDEAAFCKDPHVLMNEILRPALDRVEPLGGALICSTPDGRNWFYDIFNASADRPDWKAWHYTSEEGGFITRAAIEAAKADFTYEKWRQEYFAEFINPTNLVYYNFVREQHPKQLPFVERLDIHWAWDFNVAPACHSSLSHIHKGKTYVFDEICAGNTPANIDEFCQRYSPAEVGAVYLYGDYNGSISTTGTTDYALIIETLQRRGYPKPQLQVYGGNPIVRNRTENVNRLLKNAMNEQQLYIATDNCKKLVKDLELLKRAEAGQIDKVSDKTLSHISDALGYQLWVTHPPKFTHSGLSDEAINNAAIIKELRNS